MGNLLTITATSIDQKLQTPMYFFLRSLASLDILFISSTVPKLLSTIVTSDKSISLNGCLVQLYIYVSAGGTVFYTLGLLSIDRYLAICHPLWYNTIMTGQFCWRTVACLWVFGFLEFIPAILLMSGLHWCSGNNVIDHFFCDGSALLHLSCSDTQVVQILFFSFACFSILSSIIPTISSYCFIISSILKISSSTGRRKTFSTCSSHFLAVMVTYGSCIFIYVCHSGTMPSKSGKTVAVFNRNTLMQQYTDEEEQFPPPSQPHHLVEEENEDLGHGCYGGGTKTTGLEEDYTLALGCYLQSQERRLSLFSSKMMMMVTMLAKNIKHVESDEIMVTIAKVFTISDLSNKLYFNKDGQIQQIIPSSWIFYKLDHKIVLQS
ncbi:olfactory receptor 6C3-like [Leptodactylus fuscus]